MPADGADRPVKNTGEKRIGEGKAGPGRPKGVMNKATAEIKLAARKHGPEALKTLVDLMTHADSSTAKIAAAREILDRAYGKATQPHGEDPEMRFSSKEQRDASVAAATRADT